MKKVLQKYGLDVEDNKSDLAPHSCFEAIIRSEYKRAKKEGPAALQEFVDDDPDFKASAAEIRSSDNWEYVEDEDKQLSDEEVVKRCYSTGGMGGFFFSFCRGALEQKHSTWHCKVCYRGCMGWREWHCKGKGKRKKRIYILSPSSLFLSDLHTLNTNLTFSTFSNKRM